MLFHRPTVVVVVTVAAAVIVVIMFCVGLHVDVGVIYCLKFRWWK